MRILLDTSIIVEIDRQNDEIKNLLQQLVERGDELIISTITVAEILTGSYLRIDTKIAIQKAKDVLNQCTWKDVDAETAEICAQLYSLLFVQKKQDAIEYPDVLIATTFFSAHCDLLVTLNVSDFSLIERLKEKVYTPSMMKEYEKLRL